MTKENALMKQIESWDNMFPMEQYKAWVDKDQDIYEFRFQCEALGFAKAVIGDLNWGVNEYLDRQRERVTYYYNKLREKLNSLGKRASFADNALPHLEEIVNEYKRFKEGK